MDRPYRTLVKLSNCLGANKKQLNIPIIFHHQKRSSVLARKFMHSPIEKHITLKKTTDIKYRAKCVNSNVVQGQNAKYLGAIHKLRKQARGEGVSQMLMLLHKLM